jgi:ribosomal protein S18 acetylase RimI-like enzyme
MKVPDFLTTMARLRSGESITLRPLRADDADQFWEYLGSLSPQTRSRYGPHPFDEPTARAICASLDPGDVLRMVATIPGAEGERIIAYVLLKLGILEADRQRYEKLGIPLVPATDCTLAPSVADEFQDQGIGSLMIQHILEVAPKLGRRRIVLWLGVQATNDRAVHFYTKWGFRNVGEFYTDKNNYDMILDLNLRS